MNETRPSKKQRELLNFIDGFIKGHGYGPSYREVMRALNYKSVSTVATHIDELIKKGHLLKRERSARSLEVVANDDSLQQRSSSRQDQEKWLLDRIHDHFKKAESTASQKVIDDLFVLVGALHVLGLDDAHRSFKTRLLSLVKDT